MRRSMPSEGERTFRERSIDSDLLSTLAIPVGDCEIIANDSGIESRCANDRTMGTFIFYIINEYFIFCKHRKVDAIAEKCDLFYRYLSTSEKPIECAKASRRNRESDTDEFILSKLYPIILF